jgi:hypothetical protein
VDERKTGRRHPLTEPSTRLELAGVGLSNDGRLVDQARVVVDNVIFSRLNVDRLPATSAACSGE